MPRGEVRKTIPGSEADRARLAIEREQAKNRSGYGPGGAPGQGGANKGKNRGAQGAQGTFVPRAEDDDDWKPRSWAAQGGSVIDHLPERPELDETGWQPLEGDRWLHAATGWAWHTSGQWWHPGFPQWVNWDEEFKRHDGR